MEYAVGLIAVLALWYVIKLRRHVKALTAARDAVMDRADEYEQKYIDALRLLNDYRRRAGELK